MAPFYDWEEIFILIVMCCIGRKLFNSKRSGDGFSYFVFGLSLYPEVKIAARNVTLTNRIRAVPICTTSFNISILSIYYINLLY